MGRAMIAMFIVGFFFIAVSFIAGVRGCWKTSPSDITASAVLILIACKLFSFGLISAGSKPVLKHTENTKFLTTKKE